MYPTQQCRQRFREPLLQTLRLLLQGAPLCTVHPSPRCTRLQGCTSTPRTSLHSVPSYRGCVSTQCTSPHSAPLHSAPLHTARHSLRTHSIEECDRDFRGPCQAPRQLPLRQVPGPRVLCSQKVRIPVFTVSGATIICAAITGSNEIQTHTGCVKSTGRLSYGDVTAPNRTREQASKHVRLNLLPSILPSPLLKQTGVF